MRAFLRGRASQVLLWGALILAAVSTHGAVPIEAQEPAMRWDGLIELISARHDYPPPTSTPPNPADGPSEMTRHAVSGDGRYIVFTAHSPVLGFYGPAVYIRDRRMGDTRVLVGGTVNPGSALRDAVISADGRHVAFTFCEPYMRPDQLPICDIWAMDTFTSAWTPLSVGLSGEFGNGHSDQPVLSSTGRFLVFRTAATNLVSGPAPTAPQLVIRDRDRDGNGIFDEPGTERIEFVSTPDGRAGWYSGNGPSETAEVSADGRYVAFRSLASDLVHGDTNNAWDVFRRDRQARETRRVNVRPYQAGYDESPVSINSPAISMTPDGRYIAFASVDPMLAPSSIDDYNNVSDVFVYDADYQTVQRLDIGYGPPVAGGQVPGNGPTEWPTLSDDGRYVSVQSAATNVEVPPYPNTTHAYVIDRLTGSATRVSRKPDGTEPDRDCVRPMISGDGSLVAFVSQAFNFAPNVVTDSDRVYAAVHFEITPPEQTVPGGGGSATYEITTQQHTLWWIDWTFWEPWVSFESSPMGTGSGTVTVKAYEPNPTSARRSATIRFFEKSVVFTQLEGLSLTSVSPASGPDTGGTQVTLRGTGFEPGMRVIFGGADATAVEFVDTTTLVATSPAHAPETVYVGVLAAAPPDYRSAWIDAAFRFTDTTPPQLWYGFSEYPNDEGWFRTDVTLYWAWWDPESPVTSTSGCDMTTIAADTPGTTYTCTATGEGGSASLSAFVKRDATAPTATITSPQPTIYDVGEVVQPAFTCSDALSGVGMCTSEPVDTSAPGYRTFLVSMTDRAGNPGVASVDYAVGSGACAAGLPDNLGWWRMEGNTLNTRSNGTSPATRVGLTSDVYVDAVVGQGYQFAGTNGYLQTPFHYNFLGGIKKWGMAAWVKPSANTLGTIVRRREGFSLARLANGSVAWAFRKTTPSGLSYYDTGVKLPLNVWSHVVVVLDNTVVRTYVNGRLAHTATDIGIVYATESYGVTIGGADDRPDYFKGVLDEVQLFQNGLNDLQVEQLFLSGSAGACVPKKTTFQIVEPIPAEFGSPTYSFDVRLVDEEGMPVVGRSIELFSQVGAWPYSTSTVNRVTDSDGRVHWDAPLKNAPRGLFEEFTGVTFSGDADYVRQYTEPDVLVGKGNPVITWPAPAPITYSFPVNSTQLNATANVPGTFSYSVPSGTLLPAGTQTLTATFTPTNTTDYNTVTASNTITVNKAAPNVLIEGVNPWMYTGTAPTIVGKVKDRFNNVIATPTLTYDGSPDPPTMPGSYTVVASFAGNANYEPGSATVTWTITKRVVDIQIFAQDVTYDGASHGAGYLISGLYPDFPFADGLTYNGSENSPVNVGTYTVVVTYNGSNIYQAATATKTFTIHKAAPTVTVTGGTFAYNGTPRPASGTVIGGGGISLGVPVLTYNGSPDPPVNGGTYNVVGTFAGDANHHPATGSATITINKVVPVVTVTGGTYTYDGQPHPATASATGVGSVQLPELVVTYNGSPDVPVNAGGYSVTATYPGNANYVEIVRHAIVQINRAAATVTVTGGTFVYDGQPHPATVSVTGVGGVDLGPVTVNYDGSSGPPVNAGGYLAWAVFNGDANHEYDSDAAVITITKAVPAIVVNGGTFTYTGQAHPATGSVTGAGGVDLGPLTFTYGGSSEPPVNAGSYTALGSYAGSANYTSASRQASITIGKASPTVVVNGGTFTYDMYAHPATGTVTGANGAALGVPSFTYNGSTSPPMNVGTYDVVGTFAGDANHNGSSGTATITIEKATPVLNWNRPAAIVYGTPLGGAQLNATAVNVGGVFTYSPAAGTVLNAGAGQTLTVTFTPFNTQNYVPASATTTIDVSQAAPVLSWPQPASIVHGTPLGAGQLNATANVAGSFSYSPAAGTVLSAGPSQTLTATFTPADSANYTNGSVTTTLNVSKAAPVLSWPQPAAIVHGAPLGAGQLNATANVAGSFSYSPAAGTVLNAGPSQILTATFTPDDSANYSSGSVTTTIDVSRAIATVTATGGTFTYDGQPHSATGAVTGLNGLSLGTPSFTYDGSIYSPVNAGSYAVVASFAGNSNYEPASATATITIGKASTVLGWSQPGAIVYGTPLGAAQLNASSNVPGTFAYSPAAGAVLSAGSHQLTATFTPADAANYTGGSVSTSISVGAAPLSIRANDVAKPFGAPLPVFTASGAGFVNGDSFASLSGALAFATSATAQSAVGTYPVTPSGLSSSNYVLTFVTGTLSIVRGAVTVAVSASPAPSGLNQPMTFTASVGAAAPAAGTPGGTVRFFDGSTLLGSSTLSAGSTSFTTAGLAAGVHTIQATYDGDGSFLAGTGSASHTVNSAASTPSITIASNRNPSSVGQSVTLTATLSMSAGPVSGTVQFYDGAALLGASTIVSGSATFTTTGFAAGSHAITVRYLGSPSAPPAISGVFVQAVGASGWKNRTSSATLSASPNPSAPGAPVTLTADITGTSGTPAGAVLFMVNGEVVGGPVTLTATSGSTGRATFVLPGLPGGRHLVTATYLGNSNYKGSTASVTQAVN